MPNIQSTYTDAEQAAIDKVRAGKVRRLYQHDATMWVTAMLTPPPPTPDTTPPTATGRPLASWSAEGVVTLTWPASSDDRGVAKYEVHRGAPGFTPSASTGVGETTGLTLTDTLVGYGDFSYRVIAVDAAGNRSSASSEALVSRPDATAPSPPASPAVSVTPAGSVTLSWTPAHDNVGVSGYEVHRGPVGFQVGPNSEHAALQTSPYAEVVTPGTYAYRVVALDAAGNRSVPSGEVAVTYATTPPPPPTTPQPPAAVTGGAIWKLIFGDDFAGIGVDPSKWNVQDNSTFGSSNNELERYMKANTVVKDGTLRLIAKAEDTAGGYHYTSGMVTTRAQGGTEKFKFLHGYAEVRMRLGKGGGLWPAFWLVGAQGGPSWPAYGEVDVVEIYGSDSSIESNFHKAGGNIGAGHHAIGSPQDWHTYGIRWEGNRLQWVYDGKVVRTYVAANAADIAALGYEHTMILNLAVGGAPEKWHGWDRTWAPGELPATLEVDYVRVWQP